VPAAATTGSAAENEAGGSAMRGPPSAGGRIELVAVGVGRRCPAAGVRDVIDWRSGPVLELVGVDRGGLRPEVDQVEEDVSGLCLFAARGGDPRGALRSGGRTRSVRTGTRKRTWTTISNT